MSIDLRLSDLEISQFQDGAPLDNEKYLAAFNQSIAITLSISEENKLNMAVNSAVDKACIDMGIQPG
ncbi:hypothetical protein [Chromobacterium violaceum]|uniref:hypothetical protein n=1 Tax=Chromobacterium violaceum TaxID=536 RepID=UPI001054929D|nr:hypothetical protein [Chromobacterium violaceum]